jgi:hypothetical protein
MLRLTSSLTSIDIHGYGLVATIIMLPFLKGVFLREQERRNKGNLLDLSVQRLAAKELVVFE